MNDETYTDKDSIERCVIGIEMKKKKLKRLSKYKKLNVQQQFTEK